jgi:hypothetical protein
MALCAWAVRCAVAPSAAVTAPGADDFIEMMTASPSRLIRPICMAAEARLADQ